MDYDINHSNTIPYFSAMEEKLVSGQSFSVSGFHSTSALHYLISLELLCGLTFQAYLPINSRMLKFKD